MSIKLSSIVVKHSDGIQGHEVLAKVEGSDAAALTAAVAKYTQKIPTPLSKTAQAPAAPPTAISAVEEKGESTEELNKRLKELMTKSDVVLFMKGDPTTPRCGFSRKIVALLQEHKTDFTTFDILTDDSVRQGESLLKALEIIECSLFVVSGLKELNQWPTFPQLIIKGEFVGGLDVVTEMAGSGELQELLEQ